MLAVSSSAWATPKDTFQLANDAFAAGDLDRAIALYEYLTQQKLISQELFYNLGTAHAHQEGWGAARFYLEKALLEDPGHEQIQHNLSLIKGQVDDTHHFPQYPFFATIASIHSQFGQKFLSIGLLSLLYAIGFLLIINHLKTIQRTKIYLSVLVGLLVVNGFLLMMEHTYLGFHLEMGIVAKDGTELFPHPDTSTEANTYLSAGCKARVNESVGPWVKVDLADGSVGWLQTDKIVLLSANTFSNSST